MSVDRQTLLDHTESAIDGLLLAMADTDAQEYQLPDGRRVKRFDFDTALTSLRELRSQLRREIGRATNNPIRLGRLSRSVRR